MKKLTFSLLFFSAIAWLWIARIIAADGLLANSAGTTVVGGSVPITSFLTNQSTLGWTNLSSGIALTVQSSTASSPTNQVWRYTDGTIRMSQGVLPSATTYNGLWFGNIVPGTANYTLLANGGSELDINTPNGTGQINFRLNNTPASGGLVQITHNVMTVSTNLVSSASITATNSFMLPTNYVAANFTPVAGMVKIVSSNGILWKVTEASTTLLSANTP